MEADNGRTDINPDQSVASHQQSPSIANAETTTSATIAIHATSPRNISSTTIYINNNDHISNNNDPLRNNTTAATSTATNGDTSTTATSVLKYEDMEYAIQSFYTILQPVFCTMVLSALAVVYISTPESSQETQQALESAYYVVHSNPETDTASTQFGNSLLNALVIVTVICCVTFIIVLLYKYNCIKCLIGYMIISIGIFLGYLGAIMFNVAIERYQLFIDKVTFILTMYNFAVVGVISIFFGTPSSTLKIVPVYMNQIYLVLVSVIIAWQLSHFDDWTAWVLLVLLALYDLFAVLTPYGPLKALVNLMQRENAPSMPGLLYEASLSTPTTSANAASRSRTRTQRPRRQQQQLQQPSPSAPDNQNNINPQHHQQQNQTITSNYSTSADVAAATASLPIVSTISHHRNEEEQQLYENNNIERYDSMNINTSQTNDSNNIEITLSNSMNTPINNDATSSATRTGPSPSIEAVTTATNSQSNKVRASDRINTMYDVDTGEPSTYLNDEVVITQPLIQTTSSPQLRSGIIPFAIAKLYRLRFRHDPQPIWITNPNTTNEALATTTTTTTTSDASPDNPNSEASYTPEQLKQLVEVVFPSSGGSIVPTISLPNTDLFRQTQQNDINHIRYTVIDNRGVQKRVLFVNDDGRVFQDLREEHHEEEQSSKVRNSIKLGLGDFIFYSILVSKAALYGYATFVICTLAVLSGLGLTLLLLAIYGHALPALPISIMLGVLFYLITRFVIEPWIEDMYLNQIYV